MHPTASATGGAAKKKKKTGAKKSTAHKPAKKSGAKKSGARKPAKKTDAKKAKSPTLESLKKKAKSLGITLSKDGKAKTKSQLSAAIAYRTKK